MFSIRTTLVVAAFVAAGLFSAAEYVARAITQDDTPFTTVRGGSTLPGEAVELTRRALDIVARGKGSPAI